MTYEPYELRKGANIAARLLDLGSGVLRLVKTLPRDAAARHIASQLVRSATAGGANYEEARAAESPSDFIHKVSIATKELRETIYWLKLVEHSKLSEFEVPPLISEAMQLTAILTASMRTARENLRQAGNGRPAPGPPAG